MDKMSNVAGTIEDSLDTLTIQLDRAARGVTNFADALAVTEGQSSSLELITAEVGKLASSLDKIDVGVLDQFFDIGDSNVEENL
jgi:hypothetical protein